MTQLSLYSSSPSIDAVGSSSFCFHTNIIDSSSPDAKYCPFGDHLTTFTAF